MTEFIATVILIFIVIHFINKAKSKKASVEKKGYSKIEIDKSKKIIKPDEASILYKKKGVKVFDLKGLYYSGLNSNKHTGLYYGIAKCIENPHDRYAVGVYNSENDFLGYTPKGNRRLNNSIAEWNNGCSPAWGAIRYDEFKDRWYGHVEIAVGYSHEINSKIERFFKLSHENENRIRKKEKTTQNYFQILDNFIEIKTLLPELNSVNEFSYSFPVNLISSISLHLEKEKNWEKLLELEKHTDLVLRLNDKYKQSTLKRIEKAKRKLNSLE